MVRVATARDSFEARIIAARLGADGIVWELRGAVDGPYPIGEVQVLVEAGEVNVARALLTVEAEGFDVRAGVDGDVDDSAPVPAAMRSSWLAVLALALVVLVGFGRLLALL